MKKTYYGKTVEAAIKEGLADLDIGLDEADINIIEEGSKGIFGIGSKRAQVEIGIDTGEEIQLKKKPAPKAAKKEQTQKAPQQSAQPAPKSQNTNENIAYIENFLSGLLERMHIEGTLDIKEEDDSVVVNIRSEKTGRLIGYRGETLDAIQYLTRLSLYKNDMAYKSVIVQTENYREKREQTLENLAKRLASKIDKTGKKVVLEPMKPYERRIIHATLQDYKNVTTWSEGEEPRRHVVIAPKREEN